MRKTERIIRAIAGSFVIISLILGYFVSPYWYLFTLFVGLNLFQSAFTQWCLAEEILKELGLTEHHAAMDQVEEKSHDPYR